jgi:hypothetical protein
LCGFILCISHAQVRNKDQPIIGKIELELEEQVIIDTSRMEKRPYIRDCKVDNEENVFLLTYESVMKFNKHGQLIKDMKLGRGQGPAELSAPPGRLFIDSHNNLYIYDGYKLVAIDKNFIYIRNIYLVPIPRSEVCIDSYGFFYTLKSVFEETRSYTILGKFNDAGKLVKTISSFPPMALKARPGIFLYVSHPYAPRPLYCLTVDNHIVVALNLEYQIFQYDLDGNLVSTFAVEAKREKISPQEKHIVENDVGKTRISGARINSKFEFPEHRPIIKGLFSDEKGRIYVVRAKSVLDKGTEEIIDIFSRDGKYLCQTKLPAYPNYLRNGVIYFFREETDQTGEPIYKVIRSVIKNYSSLHESVVRNSRADSPDVRVCPFFIFGFFLGFGRS